MNTLAITGLPKKKHKKKEKLEDDFGCGSIRVFIQRYRKLSIENNKANPFGKVVVIQKEWTFQELLEKLNKRFDMQVTDLFLQLPMYDLDEQDQPSSKYVSVENVDELREGDLLFVDGIYCSEDSVTLLKETKEIASNDSASTFNERPDVGPSSELNVSLSKLTTLLAKLISRMEIQNKNVEEMVYTLEKLTDLSKRQLEEFLLKTTVIGTANHGPINPDPKFTGDRYSKGMVVADSTGILTGSGSHIIQHHSNSNEISHNSSVHPAKPKSVVVTLEFNQVKTFTDHAGPIWVLKVTNDLLLSGSSDKTIKVWDLSSMKLVATLEGHAGIVHCLAVQKGKLMSGSDDKAIRVWDLNTYKCINALYMHDNTVTSLAVTERYLFSGSFNLVNVYYLSLRLEFGSECC